MVKRLIGLVAVGVLALLTGCAPSATPSTGPVASSSPADSSSPVDSSATPGPSVPPEPATVDVGDCTGSLNLSGASMAEVEVIGCEKPHYYEAYATVPLTDADYPGTDALSALATKRCAAAFKEFVGVAPEYSRYTYAYLAPDEAAWPLLAERRLTCLAGSPEGGLVGSAKGDSTLFPTKGQCTGPQDVPALEVEILDCKSPHHYEVYAQKSIDAKKAPTGKALDALIDSVCVAGFKKFVGVAATKSRYEYVYFIAAPELWQKVADHRIVCSAGSIKGGIKGTLKGAKK